MSLKQPVGQKRLTNVAVVRYKTQGLRFEIACYRNTVVSWRNQTEKNLDNVLQSSAVYTNVSKGVLANKEDLLKVFGTKDEQKTCLAILEKGELQVSDKERHAEYETLYRDVVQVLVDKCVNPHTGRPYTSGVLDRALRATHFSVDPTRSAKQQALDALPRLAASFPIARARMRFRLLLPAPCEAALLVLLAGQEHSVESREPCGAAGLSLVVTVEPGAFRLLDAFTREQCEGQGRMEVLALAVVQEGEGEGGCAGKQAPELSSQQQPREPAVTQQMARASLSDGAAPAHARQARAEGGGSGGGGGGCGGGSASAASAGVVVYARGPLAALPDEHASRRERFAELDALQPGWQVELRCRAGASVVDALFFSPAGEAFKSFADARRAAMRTRT